MRRKLGFLPTFSRSTILAVLLATFICIPAVDAREITLAWDANTEPDIAGYRLYYKADSPAIPFDGVEALEGASPIDVGNVTSANLTGLDPGTIYYFTVTAYDSSGYESSYSNIVASDWTPSPLSPENGEADVPATAQFIWSEPPSGSLPTYTLYYGTDPDLDPTKVLASVVEPFGNPAVLAGVCLFGGAGLAIRRRRLLLSLGLVGVIMLLSSCGGGGSGGSSGAAIPGSVNDGSLPLAESASVRVIEGLEDCYFTADDLQANTTYYWKVVAVEGQTQLESVTYSFTTGGF